MIKTHQITINDIEMEVVRKKIKYLRLTVYPPEGRVRIAAPLRVDDEAVRLFVISRLSWIEKHRAKLIRQGREAEAAYEYVSGEYHPYEGKRYLLNVIYHQGAGQVAIREGDVMQLQIRADHRLADRERIIAAWYRQQMRQQIACLIPKWEAVIGVKIADCRIKQMKTRWGTCNTRARRIWLNLELIKKPLHCLEYVMVHEMVHLLERYHNDRFRSFMDRFMPQWRQYRDELNQSVQACLA